MPLLLKNNKISFINYRFKFYTCIYAHRHFKKTNGTRTAHCGSRIVSFRHSRRSIFKIYLYEKKNRYLPLETGLCGATELPAGAAAAPALVVDVAAAFPDSLDCCVRGNKLGFKLGCIASSAWKKWLNHINCELYELAEAYIPCSVKLNSGGNSFPFGSRWLHSLSSLKNGWAHACRGEIRAFGVYSNSRETSAIASGGVRARNTYHGTNQGKKTWLINRAIQNNQIIIWFVS